jgi:hypothetical protein
VRAFESLRYSKTAVFNQNLADSGQHFIGRKAISAILTDFHGDLTYLLYCSLQAFWLDDLKKLFILIGLIFLTDPDWIFAWGISPMILQVLQAD